MCNIFHLLQPFYSRTQFTSLSSVSKFRGAVQDGTLVKTERLKAISYARAVVELCGDALHEDEVIEAFKDVVGLSRREVAMALMERFGLESQAQKRMDEYGVSALWQVFIQMRLKNYEAMLADPNGSRHPTATIVRDCRVVTCCWKRSTLTKSA